jgi:hypothetical protein
VNVIDTRAGIQSQLTRILDHCLDILRSATLCHGDTTLTTFGWTNKSKPQLNTRPINHKCVDWEQLIMSVEDRVVQRDEMEAMVNPNL